MNRRQQFTVGALAAMLLFPVISLAAMSFFSARPVELGAEGGRLTACPDSPNCVSSQAVSPGKAIEPVRFTGSATRAIERLRGVLRDQPRVSVTACQGNYLRAEARSLVFRFVDDLEFLADEAAGVIHVRSASRVGHYDFGVNRRRVNRIRAAFERAAAGG